jgi:hypothetical protein
LHTAQTTFAHTEQSSQQIYQNAQEMLPLQNLLRRGSSYQYTMRAHFGANLDNFSPFHGSKQLPTWFINHRDPLAVTPTRRIPLPSSSVASATVVKKAIRCDDWPRLQGLDQAGHHILPEVRLHRILDFALIDLEVKQVTSA